jgi:hypothetical protein
MLTNGTEEMKEDTWEGIGWRGNGGNISGDLHPHYNPLPEGRAPVKLGALCRHSRRERKRP